MLWTWSYPISKKGVVPLNQLFLKSRQNAQKLFARNFVFIEFAGCRAEILFKNNSFSSISLCMWSSKKPNNRSFCIFLSIIIFSIFLYYYYSSPFMFPTFRSTFFLGTPPSGCFSLYMSKCYTQKSSLFEKQYELIYQVVVLRSYLSQKQKEVSKE